MYRASNPSSRCPTATGGCRSCISRPSIRRRAAPPPGWVAKPLPKPESNEDYDADFQSRDHETKNQKQETAQEQPPQEQAPKVQAAAASGDKDPIEESIKITEHAVQAANKLLSIDTLAEIPREESIEEARKILRNLRNMEFTDRSMEEFLDQGTPSAIVAKKQSFSRLIDIFSAHLERARHQPHYRPNQRRRGAGPRYRHDHGARTGRTIPAVC